VYAHHQLPHEQSVEVEAARRALLPSSSDTSLEMVRQWMPLRGLGMTGAWLLVMEFFGWREFKNRRQGGGLAGSPFNMCLEFAKLCSI
jgi:transposase